MSCLWNFYQKKYNYSIIQMSCRLVRTVNKFVVNTRNFAN